MEISYRSRSSVFVSFELRKPGMEKQSLAAFEEHVSHVNNHVTLDRRYIFWIYCFYFLHILYISIC